MHNLFSVIPENFFVPLSSPNKTAYWECLCRLFSLMNHQLSFGLEREILVSELQHYFEQSLMTDFDVAGNSSADSRDKANHVLRSLESYGWIEIETDKSYIQRVNFKEYAVPIIKSLLEIESGKRIEYQGYIYTIYSLVRSTTDNQGIVLIQILENTDLLITGLKNLNSSIKNYIDNLTKHKTVAEIMDALFNDYRANIVDKAYHRLLTSDNVSKFRPEIIERLESKSKSKKYLDTVANEISILKEMSIDDAKELIYRYLHEIIEAFRNMDDILNEINHKNSAYQRAAINRAKFLLAGSEDIRGQLKEILIGISEVITEYDADFDGIYEVEFLDELIRIYNSSLLDESSFYAPSEGRKVFEPQEINNFEPDLILRNEKLKKMVEKMHRILSLERINSYVVEQMGEQEKIMASELPLTNLDDFIKIIYVRLYGQRDKADYRVGTDEVNLIEIDGFQFNDYHIKRK